MTATVVLGLDWGYRLPPEHQSPLLKTQALLHWESSLLQYESVIQQDGMGENKKESCAASSLAKSWQMTGSYHQNSE